MMTDNDNDPLTDHQTVKMESRSVTEIWGNLGPDDEYFDSYWDLLLPETQDLLDTDLFQDLMIAGHRGLFCVNVGEPSKSEKFYVCNPLTGSTRKLPLLQFSRHPVVVHVHVTLPNTEDIHTSSYRVIAMRSSAIGTESLLRKTEVYDSVNKQFKPADDVPGSDFSLNDHQTGVYLENLELQMYPEYTRFSFGRGMLYVYNIIYTKLLE